MTMTLPSLKLARYGALALSLAIARSAAAQTPTLKVAPSGRATTVVSLTNPADRNAPARKIRIDYGQPHARGRAIVGGVVPFDTIWRTGANEATTLSTDVDLVIGGKRIAKGDYTLYTLPAKNGWQLIVNKQTGQWGTEYNAANDVARIPMRSRERHEALDAFTIWLVPAAGDAPKGDLRMSWGTAELTVDWSVAAQ